MAGARVAGGRRHWSPPSMGSPPQRSHSMGELAGPGPARDGAGLTESERIRSGLR